MNPDSAVEIDRDARHNPSAAKSMGFCLGVDIAQRCFEGRLACWQRRARAQNDFEIAQSDAFAAPGLHLASGIFGLTAESGFNWISIRFDQWPALDSVLQEFNLRTSSNRGDRIFEYVGVRWVRLRSTAGRDGKVHPPHRHCRKSRAGHRGG